MRKLMMTGWMVALAVSATISVHGGIICQGESAAVRVNSPTPTTVNKKLTKIYASPWLGVGESVSVSVDGTCLFSTTNQAEKQWTWQPLTLGNHTLTCTFGTNVLTKTLKVTALDFYVTPSPNPPMAKDNNISITPTTRNFVVSGGGNAIITSGSGTWTAAVSDPWITLNTTSGNVGYPVAYTVSANTNVEQRTGYVYVSGWVHTVTQDGVGGTISPENVTVEHNGKSGTITVTAASKMVWQARPNVNWLNVSSTSGMGAGTVNYNVAPYDEVATRQGTLTVAGNTFTVFQYGRRMKLDSYSTTQNYETHVIPITVNALAITQWSVTPNNSWISVVDAGNGQGGDLVTIAIAENPSYKARTGTVKIGTETFTVTQQGRPTAALSFSVSPTASTASVEGANGLVAVTATPDLPWTATSGANWLTVYAATATGSGNGNVVYSASPNPTLSQRTGNITITPEAASGMSAKTHKVTQPAATAALSSNGYEFEAAGESCSVDVSVSSIVQWSISESLDWLTVNGSTSRTGPGTVTLQAAANNTVYPRSGTVTIAGKTFSVSQKARSVELEYDTKLFGTDGGYESISIHPDGNSAWTAVANDPTWITIFQGDSGTGDGEILYIVSPYVGDGSARTGWITVGDKKVYITQRAYDLSIEPNGTNVVGNAGAGEFGVSASIGDVWTAIVTEPWITLVSGYDAGTGSGVVRFLYTENNTGKTRTGKIIVNGEVYTLEQRARQMVAITATAEHGGHVSGGGSYDLGTSVTLTAVPDSGYAFSHWTGAVSSMQNPLTVTADVAKSFTAVFAPLPIAFTSVVSDTNGVSLAWNNLAWAATYRIYRGVTSVPGSATVLVELPNSGNCTYLDETGDVDTTYWYWIEAEGPSDEVMSDPMTGKKEKPVVISPITYTNLRGATNPNPATYREGTFVSFENPGAVTGYTFAGWTPSQITADMTGVQTVNAAWAANNYSIAYNSNGGSGTMDATATTYDSVTNLSANGFTRTGYTFAGWATNETGEVAYAAGQTVSNLTAQSSGVVTLYAVWTINQYTVTFDANGGTGGTSGKLDYGTALVAPTVTRMGYAFVGWAPSVPATMPAQDVTCVAQWTANGYFIAYDPNGGSGAMDATAATYDSVTNLSANGFTRTGYTFAGWATNETGEVAYAAGQTVSNLTAQSSGVVTLYAVWTINQYTVTFDANSGTGGTSGKLDYGTALVAPTVTRTGYTLVGWAPTIPESMPAQDVTCVAQWAANNYSIAYNSNGGSGTMDVTTATYDSVTNVAANGFTRTGYTFAGWATNETGAAVYAAGQTVSNLTAQSSGVVTLYAVWDVVPIFTIEDNVIVAIDLNGATEIVIPEGVTDVNIGPLYDVTSVIIPEGITSIDWFMCWTSLAHVELPSSLKCIGESAFESCTSLKDILIPDDVTEILSCAFLCSGLTNVTFGSSVTNIGYYAFAYCTSLTSVTIPDGVTYIGTDAFAGCTSLRTVSLPARFRDQADVLADAFDPDVTFVFREVGGGNGEDPVIGPVGGATLADALDISERTIPTGGASMWTPVADASAIGGYSVRSGAIAPEESTWMEMSVFGAGRLTFSWRADCEKDPRDRYSYDCGTFVVDGVVKGRIDGTTTWQTVTVEIEDGGMHTFRWAYSKDDYDEDDYVGEDCIWVDHVVWAPYSVSMPEVASNATPEAVTNAIEAAGFADVGVMAAIGGNAEKYAAFKTWAGNVKVAGGGSVAAGEAAVVANTNAAVAFLLGAERLFENLPTIEIVEVMVGEKGAQGTGTPGQGTGTEGIALTVSVIVKDGEMAVNCAAEKVKEMFEAVSDLGDWANGGRDGARPSQLPVTVEFVEGDTETSSPSQLPTSSPSSMRFKVTPGDGTATRAFLRVKVK